MLPKFPFGDIICSCNSLNNAIYYNDNTIVSYRHCWFPPLKNILQFFWFSTNAILWFLKICSDSVTQVNLHQHPPVQFKEVQCTCLRDKICNINNITDKCHFSQILHWSPEVHMTHSLHPMSFCWKHGESLKENLNISSPTILCVFMRDVAFFKYFNHFVCIIL